ncbi:MAG TPA: hypothetical protein VLE19_01415 [Pyrinomonadaceae bacterium]|nr:hypothetical protein [Pyrinomonadaceae bacterium]
MKEEKELVDQTELLVDLPVTTNQENETKAGTVAQGTGTGAGKVHYHDLSLTY